MKRVVDKPIKIDLHIHSAASTETKDRGNKSLEACTVENLPTLLKALDDCKIDVCSITDHDTFDYGLYQELKRHEGEGSLKLVLPGVEFSVECDEISGGKTEIHVVAVFDDSAKEKIPRIHELLVDEDGKPRYDNDSATAFTQAGVEEILRDLGIDAVLIGHEKSAGRSNKRDISSLDAETAESIILTEFIDAVEIRNRRKELDIKRLIKTYPREGVPFVLGSDCHDWSVYPLKDSSMKGRRDESAFSCIKSLPTFRGLVMAITDHSRIKVGEAAFFGASAKKLSCIDLSVGDVDYELPLSAGINAIIGDNSVGKSLLLHALLGYRRIKDDRVLVDGYKSYCEKQGLSLRSSIDDATVCKFDDQQSVRKILEELHSADGSSDFVNEHFRSHVPVDSVVGELQRRIKLRFAALESKASYNDCLRTLEASSVELRSVDRFSQLNIVTRMSNQSYGNVDKLTEEVDRQISSLEQLKADNAAALVETGSVWASHLDKAIAELKLLVLGCKLHRVEIESENVKIDALKDAAKTERNALSKLKTDEEKAAEEYDGDLDNAASLIASTVFLSAARFNASLDLGMAEVKPIPTQSGDFAFVSELTVSQFKAKFMQNLLEFVFNKTAVENIMDGIEKETQLDTAGVCESVSNVKPAPEECFAHVLKKASDYVAAQVTERLKVTSEAFGLDAEPSPGLFSRYYFDIVSADDEKSGIYIIDQPEDQISQTSIKEHVLDSFKRMAEHRQVILITHNPQFVVNLDVDNVIAIKKDEDGPLRFYSGALEYECDEYKILDVVANTVEGGADVVRKRLKRYGSKDSDV